LNKNNIKNILVTYGDREFQNNKINSSHINKFLDGIYIVSDNQNKISAYKKITSENKNKNIFIIDDLKENIKTAIKNIPYVRAIKMNRNKKNTKTSYCKFYYEIKNLNQAEKIISQL
jgi:hypothetical protein